jgi:TolB protein
MRVPPAGRRVIAEADGDKADTGLDQTARQHRLAAPVVIVKSINSRSQMHPLILVNMVAAFTIATESFLIAADQNSSATSVRAFGGVQPRVSPDGDRIALSYQGAICSLPVGGGTLARLTSGEGFDVEPAWSPDGKQIAFINTSSFGAGQLQLIDADTGASIKLPAAIRADGRMFFHPDGRRLLGRFSAAGSPDRPAWYDLGAGGLKPVDIRPRDSAAPRAPFCLSADGRWIAYAQHQDVAGEQSGNDGPQADLWKVSADGGAAQKFVRWPARVYNLYSDDSGQGVHVVTDRGTSHNDIWHVPFENSLRGARKLTAGQADEDWPSVSRDGRVLIHSDNHEGATALVRRDGVTGASQPLAVERFDLRAPSGTLVLKFRDKQSGEPVTARVSLRQKGGKFHTPAGALYRVMGGRCYFYGRGEVTMTLPSGSYELAALRGPEYRAHQQEVELKADQSTAIELALERWTDPAARGWYSGENHIHGNYGYGAWYLNPRHVLDQCEGEDLNVCNIMVANSDGDGVFDREFFLGSPDSQSKPRTILYWNEEFRSTIWGHLTLGNLERLVEPIFTGFKDTTNPWDIPTNADIAERARSQRGTVSYTHPASNPDDLYDRPYTAKGLPVDAALGRIDTMDVMGSGYGASVQLWYRLLNCGFRIPAAAGTDCFLNRINSYPPGWGRAYVKIPNGLSYQAWMEGQRAGRSFVSNGPMVELSVDGKESGDRITLGASSTVRVRGKAAAQFPMDNLELIYNGRVAGTGRLSGNRLEASLESEIKIETSGWIALRAAGPSPPYLPVGGLWAHTNPIFIEVKERPLGSKADAEYFLAWIDRLETVLRKRDRMHTGKSHIEMQLAAARSVYQKLAGQK